MNPTHLGHDPSEHGDKIYSAIDDSLVSDVIKFIKPRIKNGIILTLAYSWAIENGHFDCSDGRYCITSEDITEIRRTYRKMHQLDSDDAASTYKLLKTDL